MGDLTISVTDRWAKGKGKIKNIRTDRFTHAQEGSEQKSHFSLVLHPL